jgi:hypothetical protein
VRLSDTARRVLYRAYSQGVADGEASGRTITALHRRGLIEKRTSSKGRDLWRATAAGRDAALRQPPCFLAARSQYGYTEDPARAMFAEPEVIR